MSLLILAQWVISYTFAAQRELILKNSKLPFNTLTYISSTTVAEYIKKEYINPIKSISLYSNESI